MKFLPMLTMPMLAVSVVTASAQTRKVFPYEYKVDNLDNDLRFVMITPVEKMFE